MPCLGKADSITVHHVRAVHGSATNFSGRERLLLLFQYRAADAWPLLGFAGGIEKFDELLLAGSLTLEPRLTPCQFGCRCCLPSTKVRSTRTSGRPTGAPSGPPRRGQRLAAAE